MCVCVCARVCGCVCVVMWGGGGLERKEKSFCIIVRKDLTVAI